MNFKFQVIIKGEEKATIKINGLADLIKSQEMKLLADTVVLRMEDIAGRLARKGETRNLSRVIGEVRGFGTNEIDMVIGSSRRYARPIEYGSKPHIIKPIRRKALFWYTYSRPKMRLYDPVTEKEMGLIFTWAKLVNHPGHRSYPFLRPTIKGMQPRLVRAVKALIQKKIKGNP